MKLVIERPYTVIKRSYCEVEDLNKSTLQKICELEYNESEAEYLDDTCSIAGNTKIYSEDKSLLIYEGK
jgi:hypothetical protein